MESIYYPAHNTFLSLSDEVLLMIFSFLCTEEKIVLSRVCRRFNRILFDQRLNRNFEISPKHNESCIKHVGSFMQHRRKFIYSFNISNCDRIPMQQIKMMTKGLTNLHILHVMNISMPVSVLSEVLRQSMQIQELSWTWRGDDKRVDVTWADVSLQSKEALSKLKRLYISLPDPWCHEVQEFLNYCSGLAYLTVQLDPALRKLPVYKQVDDDKLTTFKLKSFCAYHVSYGNCIDRQTIFMNDIKLEHFIEKIWNDSGELLNPWEKWENFWPCFTSRMSWLHAIQVSPNFPKFVSNVKNAIISTSVFPAFDHELKATDLIIYVESSSFPVIYQLAPNVERLTIEVFNQPSDIVDKIISSLEGLKYIVELNLVSVHMCRNNEVLSNLWTSIKSFVSLRKLAVDPCAITGLKIPGQFKQEGENINVLEEWSERMKLDHLNVFQLVGRLDPDIRCESYNVMPSVGAISAWKNLTSLTFDTIPFVRKFDHFRLVAQSCVNLSELRFRAIGPHGHCMYTKDVANSLPYCCNLKNFSIEQGHIADFLKDLLLGLSHCPKLESVCVYNSNILERSSLKSRDNLKEAILNLIKKCQFLNFIRVPVPHVTKNGCNKMKNWITVKMDRPKGNLFMEFCEQLAVNEDQFHAFPPDVPRLQYMRWISKVCATHECDC